MAELEKQLNSAVKILQRRQKYIEDPAVRGQVENALNSVKRYTELIALYGKITTSQHVYRFYHK